ncbi:putative bifunctional dTTP/UTP pyrophosphatase/methyltransferase protein isoform 2-T2 [Menidia menidia]
MVLNPVISKLAGKLVVLASSSPRRLEILRNAGLRFEVVPSWFKETLDKGLFKAPHEYAVETAKQKALEVARRMPLKHLKTPDMVIGADTIVSVDGMILEKPVDKQDAYRMLSSLSGKEHSVFTGVAIVLCHEEENQVDYQLIDFYEETKVKFADLSEDMLWEYINSGEPMDKAGGYGIQALGGMLVESVRGDFLNVVGFPLNHFCRQLDAIYNHSSSLSKESKDDAVYLIRNFADGASELTQSAHSSEAKHSSSPTPKCNSGSTSPAHKVKRTGEGSEPKHRGTEAELHDSQCTKSLIRNGEQVTEPKKEDLERVCDLLDGFKASKALFTASKLRVFDLLHDKPGLDAAQVAQQVKASVKGTECLLEACASLGLLRTKKKRSPKPAYENTDLATSLLVSDAPFSLHGYIQHCNDTLWPLYSHTESAVREGASQRERAKQSAAVCQGKDAGGNSEEVRLRFLDGMHSYSKVTAATVATAFDLSSFKTACDLGGCTGAMAYALTKAHPGLSVTVFDLPAVVELRERFLHPSDQDSSVAFVAGDFFKDELPKADLYILARVLHDLTEGKLHSLLSRIADSCTPGCGLLLSEIFLEEDRSGPSRGLLQALSLSQVRQRSAAEYSLLLKGHGFLTTQVKRTNNLLDAMLCVKA